MMDNRTKRKSNSLAEIVIVVAIVLVVNILGQSLLRYRADFTESKMYTVSPATKQFLGSLDAPLNIDFYMSGELPPQLASMRTEVKDRLNEFDTLARGNLVIRYIDPKDDEAVKQKAIDNGVPEVELQVIEKDQQSTRKTFFGMTMSYLDKTQSIPFVVSTESLEYDVISRLVRLTREKPVIGIFEGTFNANQQQGQQSDQTYNTLRQLLSGEDGHYEIQRIGGEEPVLPEGLDGIVLVGAFGLSDSMKYSIDQFLLGGGRAIIAIDPLMMLNQQGMENQAYPSLPTMEDQLEKYGVRFNKKLIADPDACGTVMVRTNMFPLPMQYPLYVQIGPEGFNDEVPAVRQLESLMMPLTCPLAEVETDGVQFTALASTSPTAYTMNSPFNVDIQQDWEFKRTESDSSGPYPVVAMLSGKFTTAFPDGAPAPTAAPPNEDGTINPVVDPFAGHTHVSVGSEDGNLIVLASARSMTDNMFQQAQPNALFAANIVDTQLLGDELLGIRSAPVTSRPLKNDLTEQQKSTWKWLNLAGVPVLLVLFGMLLGLLRGAQRRGIEAKYRGA
jgi:gliding-associated putative ABC transporter substrate-binding component GldG